MEPVKTFLGLNKESIMKVRGTVFFTLEFGTCLRLKRNTTFYFVRLNMVINGCLFNCGNLKTTKLYKLNAPQCYRQEKTDHILDVMEQQCGL